jgi:protein phosphatase 1 regulatory subunit 10
MESIGFMDALNASSTVKKDPKKRKRLPSGSSSTSTSKKDEPESPKIDHKPLKFYKDTLEENDEKTTNGETSPTKELDNSSTSIEESVEKQENGDKTSIASPNNKDEETKITEEEQEDVVRPPGIGCGPDGNFFYSFNFTNLFKFIYYLGPPGVLVNPALQRRKKRPVRWREGDELTEVRYFELDENERINVTKRPFNEQMQHEHANEGSALQRGRQLQNDDAMTEQIAWRPLIIVDNVPTYAYGSKSNEANIQAERERNVLQAFFIPNQSINDSPLEPNHESYEHVEPQMIPLDDQTNNPEAVMDYTEIQWPLPKGDIINTIHPTANAFATMFNSNIPSNIAINNSSISNPLLPFGGNQTNSMWTIPPVSFQQPPPNLMPNHQGGNRGNFNNFNNRHNNNGNNNNGGNWIRGNAGGRRIGVCHQFRRNGVCRNQQCPYIHER